MQQLRKTLSYLADYRKEAILAPAFKLLEALMELFVPLVIAAIINQGIGHHNSTYVWWCFALLLGMAFVGMAFSFTAQWFTAKASVGCVTSLRQALFDHIGRLSYSQLDKLGTDTLITRLTSDINQVQNGLNLTLRLLLRSPFIVFGAVVMAFFVNVKAAIIFVITIPILSAVVFGIMLITIPLYTKSQNALDKLTKTSRQNLTGVRVIRAFGKEADEIAEFDQENHALTKINEFVGRLSSLMNPATYIIINVATIFLIQRGAIQVNFGHMAQGDVVALYNYMAQIVVELIKLASLVISINRAIACANRIQTVLDLEPDMTYPQALNTPAENDLAVAFQDVSLSYNHNDAQAVSKLNFRVQTGQTIGIIGGTGSGKSTLVNLLARFYDATHGKITVAGHDVKAYPAGQLIDKIGIVPQKAVLFEGTIRSNLQWGKPDATEQELWQALEVAQAKEIVQGKAGGLDAQVEQNGRNFSGGQRQRLTIARALVKQPDILILDDSASALDFATDLKLRRALKKLAHKMTIFIVSQRTSSVRTADNILVLDQGQIVGQGNHDHLMATCEVYQEIYYSQFPKKGGH